MNPDSPHASARMHPEELKVFLLGGWQPRSYLLSNVVDGSVGHPPTKGRHSCRRS